MTMATGDSDKDLEFKKLDLDRYKFDRQLAIERFKMIWISGVLGAVVAGLGYLGTTKVAELEADSKTEIAALEEKIKDKEIQIKNLEQNRQYVTDFVNHALSKNYQYRIDFAEYVFKTISDEKMSAAWKAYHDELVTRFNSKQDRINELRQEIEEIQQAVAAGDASRQRELAAKTAELRRVFDELYPESTRPPESAPPAGGSAPDPDYLADFDQFFRSLGLKHVQPEDLLVRGAADKASGLNSPPPRELWPNGARLARVLDEFFTRVGEKAEITSAYRSPTYNASLSGTTSKSTHLQFIAADIRVSPEKYEQWVAVLSAMRSEGIFRGGIGRHKTFIHLDVRGTNANWGDGQGVENPPGEDNPPTDSAEN